MVQQLKKFLSAIKETNLQPKLNLKSNPFGSGNAGKKLYPYYIKISDDLITTRMLYTFFYI